MLSEALAYLEPKSGKNYIDATLGGAGYTLALAERIGTGKVLAIDLDELAIANAEELIKKRKIKNLIIANDNFANIEKIIEEKFKRRKIKFSGIVFDLGLSSAQLADRSRGFSFAADTPLLMNFSSAQGGELTERIVNREKETELARIFREFGEEKFAWPIAKSIARRRKEKPIRSTGALVAAIEGGLPKGYLKKSSSPRHSRGGAGTHFAPRVFQALRIATNDELGNLRRALSAAAGIIEKKGRVVVVSYHSLEDRIVKNFFRDEAKGCICPPQSFSCSCGHEPRLRIITKKPLVASAGEIARNPRARSAKLRAAEII